VHIQEIKETNTVFLLPDFRGGLRELKRTSWKETSSHLSFSLPWLIILTHLVFASLHLPNILILSPLFPSLSLSLPLGEVLQSLTLLPFWLKIWRPRLAVSLFPSSKWATGAWTLKTRHFPP